MSVFTEIQSASQSALNQSAIATIPFNSLNQLSQWSLELLVCSTALMILAWLLVATIGSWSAAVRHRVWFLTFGGLAVLPIALLFLPPLQLPLLPPSENQLRSDDLSTNSGTVIAQTTSDFASPASDFAGSIGDSVDRTSESDPAGPLNLTGRLPVAVSTKSGESNNCGSLASPASGPVSAAIAKSRVWFCLILVWAAGLMFCVGKILMADLLNRRLALAAKPIEEPLWQALLSEFRNLLALNRHVCLLESQQAIVPMTWGVRRPVVALPPGFEAWTQLRRRAVLMHELAHVKRHDVLIQTVSYLVCGLYWFHPLAWYALRRLRIERELACDDCVIATGQKPSDYAQQLVQIAKGFKFENNITSVAMASSSKLEQRVVSLLDLARSHVPVSRNLSRCLLFGAFVAIVALSTVRIGHRAFANPEPVGNSIVSNDNPSVANVSVATNAAVDGAVGVDMATALKEGRVLTGTVRDPDGNPLPGAEVGIYLWFRTQPPHVTLPKLILTTKSGSDGKFRLKLSPQQIDELLYGTVGHTERDFMGRGTTIVASSNGFGSDWISCRHKWKHRWKQGVPEVSILSETKPIELQLVQAKVPIEGQIVDLEGQPVSDAIVRVTSMTSTDEDLDQWHERASKNRTAVDKDEMERLGQKGSGIVPEVHYFPYSKNRSFTTQAESKVTKTDEDGRFRLEGLGDDRAIGLEVAGEGIASTKFSAITRNFGLVPMPNERPDLQSQVMFGSKPVLAVQPDQPISGKILDAETGEPIAGLRLKTDALTIRRFVDETGYSTTDADGRYAIRGLARPSSRKLWMSVYPEKDQPYFSWSQEIPKQLGVEPIKQDLKLRACRFIHGRLEDSKTNQSVRGRVMYYPMLDNENARQYDRFDENTVSLSFEDAAFTNENGEFSVKAIDGAGILAVQAEDGRLFEAAIGGKESGISMEFGGFKDRVAYLQPGANHFNTIHPINIDDSNADDIVQVKLIRRDSKSIEVVNQIGEPVANPVCFRGRFPQDQLHGAYSFVSAGTPLSHIEVFGLKLGEKRQLLVWSDDKTLATFATVDQASTGPIVLKPVATIRGKLKSADPSRGYISAKVIGPMAGEDKPAAIPVSECKVKEDGSFELLHIPADATCTVRVMGFEGVKDVAITDPTSVRQTVDLGIVDMGKPDETFPAQTSADSSDVDAEKKSPPKT